MRRAKTPITITRYGEEGKYTKGAAISGVYSHQSLFCYRYSFARMPINRGIRARKYKTQASNNQTQRRSTATVVSDEEGNTSEYSHSPSSVHSTLESNPDIASMYKQAGLSIDAAQAKGVLGHSDDDDSSSDESDLNAASSTTQTSRVTIYENVNDEN